MHKGKIVKRKSYGQDIRFKVLHVYRHEGLVILKSLTDQGSFYADAPLEDLVEETQKPRVLSLGLFYFQVLI